MFAVIRTGGKQYRVTEQSRIEVERLSALPGETLEISDVLMVGGTDGAPLIGAPALDQAIVFAEVVEQTRGEKILVFKKKRRKNYRRTRGHRQHRTVLRIVGISPSGERPEPRPAKAAAPATTEPESEASAPEAPSPVGEQSPEE